MRKINKPNISQDDIYNSFRGFNKTYKDRVNEYEAKYELVYTNSDVLLKEEQLYENNNSGYHKYMKNLYTNRLASSDSPAYKYYTVLKNTVDCCPFCNYPTRIIHIDHFLPKSFFPVYTIVIKNLVPICFDCNSIKGNMFEGGEGDKKGGFLHPYFDELLNQIEDCLKCEIVEADAIGFFFHIEHLKDWSDKEYERVLNHFEKLKLNELYFASLSSTLLSKMNTFCATFFSQSKKEEISSDDVKEFINFNEPINIYEKVLYNTLYDNAWFCETYLPNYYKERIKQRLN